MPSRTPIERLIDAAPMRCTLCQQPAGTCQCWEACSCGYSTRRSTPCRNPETTNCSTKLKYGRRGRCGTEKRENHGTL